MGPKNIKAILFLFSTLAVSLSCMGQPPEAWQTIFNGTDLEGWSVNGGKATFDVQEGLLRLQMKRNTEQHTFLQTDKKYKDFILEVDCKRDSSFYYGILFRAQDAPDTAHVRLYGYQVKVDHISSRKWTGGIFDDFGNTWNWLYTLANDVSAQHALKPAGEWDHYRIEAIGHHIKVWINDVPTANMLSWKYRKGYIAFKIHQIYNEPELEKSQVWVKNIQVVTENPRKYARKMDIPTKVVE